MFKKVLIPVDGSKDSFHYLDVAKEIGKEFEAELIIFSVVQAVDLIEHYPSPDSSSEDFQDMQIGRTTAYLKKMEEALKDYPYPTSTSYATGNPAREILKFAEAQGIDLIIMGNRGLGAFSRTLLGSVSQKVLNHANVSVLVVKKTVDK